MGVSEGGEGGACCSIKCEEIRFSCLITLPPSLPLSISLFLHFAFRYFPSCVFLVPFFFSIFYSYFRFLFFSSLVLSLLSVFTFSLIYLCLFPSCLLLLFLLVLWLMLVLYVPFSHSLIPIYKLMYIYLSTVCFLLIFLFLIFLFLYFLSVFLILVSSFPLINLSGLGVVPGGKVPPARGRWSPHPQ